MTANLSEVQALENRLNLLETRLQHITEIVAHTVVRDVGIVHFLGFPSYFFRQDAAFKANSAGGPSPYVDMSLRAAQDLVEKRIAGRAHKSPGEVVKSFWSTFNKYDYNGIHTPLLAILHEAGFRADFVDVGANVGDTAMAAAETIEVLNLDGHVHSFEPGPVFELARANVSLNRLGHRITVYNVAASDTSGYAPMQILIGHTESGSLGGISAHYDLPLGETRFVSTVRLDEFLPNDGRSFLIKIDAEGVDFSVIRGAKGLIESRRAPIMTLEFTPKYNSPEDIETARGLFQGYALFNLRGLNADAYFDRFDMINADHFDSWMADVAASPAGWADVAFISRELLATDALVAFREAYNALQSSNS